MVTKNNFGNFIANELVERLSFDFFRQTQTEESHSHEKELILPERIEFYY